MKNFLLAGAIALGLLTETAEPILAASNHHRDRRHRRSGRNRRARNVAIGAGGGAAAGALIGGGRGAGAGALIGGTTGALVPTRRRRRWYDSP